MPNVSKSKAVKQRAADVKEAVFDKASDLHYSLTNITDRQAENIVASVTLASIGGGLVVSAVSGARGNYKGGLFALAFSATATGIGYVLLSS